MATIKKATEEVVQDEAYWNELVPFYAFKDAGKYSDDIISIVNGEAIKIQRGKQVMIPRKHYANLADSAAQDAHTADLITDRSSEFEAEAKAHNL